MISGYTSASDFKFIEKFKTRVKNQKIEKIIAFNKYLRSSHFILTSVKIYFLR